MIDKEIAELRRRFRADKCNITQVRGCYVNEKREIVSQFSQSLATMPEEEAEKLLAILKRTLSGTLGKNLIDIAFDTQQVVDSDEHRLLTALRGSSLGDEEAVGTFYQKVIGALNLEGNYLILLTHDTYDVPSRARDGAALEDANEVFSYILCSVCPVKMPKPGLSYSMSQNALQSSRLDWMVSAPELGFLFPAFDDRRANLYSALYYTRGATENHQEFVDAVFCRELPMPADVQKETFQSILENTLADDCRYEVVQAVNDQLRGIIEEHKESREEEPPALSKEAVKGMLQSCGVAEEHIGRFDERFDAEFGAGTDLNPRNIVDVKQFEVCTPDVTIHVSPEHSGLIETRVIDGARYLLIRAGEDVEVNGVKVHI